MLVTLHDVRQFLGFFNHYHSKKFSQIGICKQFYLVQETAGTGT